jgi:hypothetical protein
MNPSNYRSWKSVAAILAVLLTVPVFAQKRRAVAHPSPAAPGVSVSVSGKVLDAVTGAPVVFATVRFGTRSDRTDATGSFKVTSTIYGQADVTAERSGYVLGKETVTAGGPLTLTLRLQPTPTVRLRLVDGTQRDVDFESVEFGYVPPFGSYIKSDSDDFCKADGSTIHVSRTEMARITGPAVSENTGCCGGVAAQKITMTLKTGETTPLYFTDSCDGTPIDFIARDHISGQVVYTKFSNLAEIVFP